MTAREIALRTGGVVVGDDAAVATSWAFDSRDLQPGACFVALAGERDGHAFVGAAFDAGASIALVARPVTASGTLVIVDDTLAALQTLARADRDVRAHVRVVGVAGSTGKTSTKDLLTGVLGSLSVHANLESYNNEFGLPVTLLNAPAHADIVVAELGERFPGDLALLCEIARPEVGIVTNVGLAHAQYLGGAEGAAAVLAELLESFPPGGLAVLNADDEWTSFLARRTQATVVTVGTAESADYRISDVEVAADLTVSFEFSGRRLHVPLRGEHHVHNAAMAAVVAREAFAVSWSDIEAGVRTARPSRWRMEVFERDDDVVVVNDAYNANPDSMAAALRALVRVPERRRRIAVLGDMRELGHHAPAAHANVGHLAAGLGIDVVVGVGDGGALIADAAGAGGASVYRAADADAASALVCDLVRPGDAVLVKASRALGLQRVAEAVLAGEVTS
jgi:UDP-N-acetylmuramoyl-tripeptide--D-alanyl-D-alanine ligase